MKPYLVFLLALCLVWAGIPNPSSADAPKTLNANEKANVTSLSTTDLIQHRAVEIAREAQKLDPLTKNFFKQLEAQNPWLLDQRAGDDSVVPPPSWPANAPSGSSQRSDAKKDGGITTGGAVLITLGAVAVLGIALLASWHGGSC